VTSSAGSGAPVVALDLGNSRLKAGRWLRRGRTWERVAGFEGEPSDAFGRWLSEALVEVAALASVAARERTEGVCSWLEQRGIRVVVAPPTGLENLCREPERVGADRLYAAAAGAQRLGRSCLVVDAGTALTVDAVRVEGERPAFLGGAIAPGPELAAAALATGTARLPRVTPRPGGTALGTDTESALRAGIGLGLHGAAERLVEELARELGWPDAPVVLTGGARAFLLEPRPFTARALDVVPELVEHGLVLALERSARAEPA
jgi:type III pantothenate kinase